MSERRCPSCQTAYPDWMRRCSVDGAQLVGAAEASTATVTSATDGHRSGGPGARSPDRQAEGAVSAVPFGELAEGMTVGEYVIEAKIGEGGMGTVYRAVHPIIGKRVAIKVLMPQLATSEHMVTRFVHEARAVNQIRHRNIVDIFLFGQLPDRRHFLVMELLEGESLRSLLTRRQRLAPGEALPILLPICDALAAAHRAGVVHRDLKPDNVFLTHGETLGETVKLLDFGIAKQVGPGIDGQTLSGALIGTPRYMSPEQLNGSRIDARTDLYALGVMMFEMLTGTAPFRVESFLELAQSKLDKPPPHPSGQVPLPAVLDALVVQLLAPDPDDRPADAQEVRRVLGELARDLATAPVNHTPAGPPPLRPERRRVWPWVAGGAALGLAVLGVVALGVRDRRPAGAPPLHATPVAPPRAATAPRAEATPTPTPPTPTRSPASLTVRTGCPGAEFWLDGKRAGDGSGTLSVPDLSPGPHTLRIKARGRRERTGTIVVEPGRVHDLLWPLAVERRSRPKPAGDRFDQPIDAF